MSASLIAAPAPLVGRKINALDGVRGLAIALVLLHHYNRFIPDSWTVRPLKALFDYGWVGVDMFFTLSGFLITGILLETRTADNFFTSFYMRRILRIFPLYYLTLIVIFSAVHFMHDPPAQVPLPADRKLYFVYLTNWLFLWKGHWGPNVVGHFWSLAVEEQFYLIWPFCVLYIPRRKLKAVALTLCAIAGLIRIVWVTMAGPSVAIAISTFTRMDSLLAGSIAAMLVDDAVRLSARDLVWWSVMPIIVFFAGVMVCGNELRAEAFSYMAGFTLLATGFSALVLRMAVTDGRPSPDQRVFCHPFLTQLGKYSYGIYVYHVPLLGALELLIYRHLPRSLVSNPGFALLYATTACALTFFVAKASYELFESRVLALKRYFKPNRVLGS